MGFYRNTNFQHLQIEFLDDQSIFFHGTWLDLVERLKAHLIPSGPVEKFSDFGLQKPSKIEVEFSHRTWLEWCLPIIPHRFEPS